jgi:sortase A
MFNLVMILSSLFGIGLLIFPHISFHFADYNQSYLSSQYDTAAAQMEVEERQAAYFQAQKYNDMLQGTGIQDPFIPGTGMVMQEEYVSALNISDNVMGHVKIPKIGIDLPIYHGTSDEILKKGAGHLEGTALPIGGVGYHTVITGHTGLSTAKMFTDLVQLAEGDEFYLYVLGDTLAYQVDQISTVEPNEMDTLRPQPDMDYATLITCTPYGINNKRLLVRGHRVHYSPQEIESRLEETKPVAGLERLLFGISIGALVILLLTVLLIYLYKQYKAETGGTQAKNEQAPVP